MVIIGSGAWSTDTYRAAATSRAATGTPTFVYTATTKSQPYKTWKTHPDMDPNGVTLRESRDSDEHPNSVAVAVLFDVTGSMLNVPIELQKRLPTLLELLQYKEYVTDAQVLFGAFGDATTDRCPLQVGQFESSNVMERWLGDIMLEGGGGGQNTESYELALYFMARHTALDCVEKRGQKGYLFMIGDEHPYPAVKPNEVRKVIGDELSEPISVEAILEETQKKYNTYFIIPGGSSHANDPTLLKRWRGLLGQNVLQVPDMSSIAETIALQVGIAQETIKLEEGLEHLKEQGTSDPTLSAVKKALTP